ncbi:MAG: hypothetical protein AB4368_13075 [Xenococcaceae cyanobacterium]
MTDWLSPVVALAVVGMICFCLGLWLPEYQYDSTLKLSGREIMNWNQDRLIKCRKDMNPKCTIWILPPELRP